MTTIHEVPADAVADHPQPCQVFVATAGRSRAVCECGWAGHERLVAASARVDAWLHAAEDGHMPATPLVLKLTEVGPVRSQAGLATKTPRTTTPSRPAGPPMTRE
jgi:hypothetical protein